jgi:hypothetical protein
MTLTKEKYLMVQNHLTDWQNFYSDGAAFHNRMRSGAQSGRLSPDVLHGLASLANEKLLMSLLMFHGIHPEGHTFFNLVSSAEQFCHIGKDLKKALMRMDEIVPLCTLDPAPYLPIDGSDVEMFVVTTEKVHEIVNAAIKQQQEI